VRANCGPVGVVSIASAVVGGTVNCVLPNVAAMSMDGGGGCLRDDRTSGSNRDVRFPNDAPL